MAESKQYDAMEKVKNILYRVQKNPETLHIKATRFVKRKILQNIRGRYIERYPYTPSLEDTKRLLGVKKLVINEIPFFLNPEIKYMESIKEANQIINGEYEILGRMHKFNKINWHQDVFSSKVWKKKHFSRITYDDENSDKKVPWELSKFQHITTLGLAYQQTKDKRYAQVFQAQVEDWIKENLYEIGINWVTPMEAAIRAVNWINGYYFFKETLPKEFLEKYITQLYLHGKFIEENLEWSPKKENHYLSDMLGLFFLGIFFKHTKKGKKWILFAKKEFEKEIIRQVSDEGVDYEGSLNYHRLVTELFILAYINGRRNNITFSGTFVQRIEKMCEFILWYTTPTGQAPSIGDTDNGRILNIWNKDINDHRDILAVAAALFRRGDFKAHGTFHTKLHLLIDKKEYEAISKRNVSLTSRRFNDYYIMRDEDIYLLIHCGDIGREGFGGHGHNDQLSFVFSTKNKDYIIDAGTYAYTSNHSMRHSFRSTASHNTLIVNKMEQNPIQAERPFDMDHKTQARCTTWNIGKEHEQFIGTHKGYAPFIVTREILYDKKKKEIRIKDKTNNEADLELNIHFNKGVNVKKEDNRILLGKEIEMETGPAEIIPSIYSPSYGIKEENKRLRIQKHGKELITVIKLKQQVQDI